MAINIAQQPQEMARSGNAITYTFTSDKVNEDNFIFIVDVFKNGVFHTSHKVVAENDTFGRFDLSEIAEIEVNKPFIPSAFEVDALNYASFRIEVSEFYGVNPTRQDLASSNNTIIIKSKQSLFESFYYADYYPSPVGGLFPTYFKETTLYPNETFYLYAYKLPSNPLLNLSYRRSDGVTNFANNTPIGENFCTGVKLDYDFIQANFGGGFWSEVDHVMVNILNGTDYYEEYKINIVHDAPCFNPTRVHYINKLGVMESFSFTRPQRKQQTTEIENFQTNNGTWFGSFYGIQNEDTGNGVFQTQTKTSLLLESGNVTEDVQSILYENLIISPYILVEYKQRLVRVSRSSVNVSYNSNKLDQIFNVSLKLDIENYNSLLI